MTCAAGLSGLNYTIVIPTIGRASLAPLLCGLAHFKGVPPAEVIIVDDRRPGAALLDVPPTPMRFDLTVVHSGGAGPASARNIGWQHAVTEWIVFLDDDVVIGPQWMAQLGLDLANLDATVAGSQGRLKVPSPSVRPTDNERRTLALESAQWITADMAYRRRVLAEVGGFDPRFQHAYREDADLGLRITDSGYRIVLGRRELVHPIASSGFWRSMRVQQGNHDDALMRRKHGPRWRKRCGEGRGRLALHVSTVTAGLAVLAAAATARRRQAVLPLAVWSSLTAAFALRRISPGPRTGIEIASMIVTSVGIPFVATAARFRGEILVLRARRKTPPTAVLFDRDGTLVVDVPYLAEPSGVVVMPGAMEALSMFRRAGTRLGVVSNQSGVGRGWINSEELAAVNRRIDDLLGPFDTWQVCPHVPHDQCDCRKPQPGLIRAAADALGVDPSECVVVGDIGSDVEAALAAGASAVLVPTAQTRSAEVATAHDVALVRASLVDAARALCGGDR